MPRKKQRVKSIDANGREVCYESTRDASRITGVSQSSISNCCRGAKYYHTAGGYRWEYVHELPQVVRPTTDCMPWPRCMREIFHEQYVQIDRGQPW